MIILKHIRVEQFRSLRDVDLYFPQRGSILIAGPNEAGKSALLESIYFALYGEPLALPRSKQHAASSGSVTSSTSDSSLDDLVRYGEKRAIVTLTLSISATEMTITREVEREKGQSVTVDVHKLGMPAEKPITDLERANERIIAEIGRIDGKTLRNSCFIEQQGLDRLEQLSGREREAALHRLLGLEKLSRLAEQFSLSPDDERRLAEATLRLRLAEVQVRIPELSTRLGELEAALDAVAVYEDLDDIARAESNIEEQHRELLRIEERRLELKNSQSRITQLKKAGAIIDEIISAYDIIAEAQLELPELEHQITELERREREELPALEQRVRELADLSRSFSTLERMASDLLNAVSTIKELEQSIKQQEYLEETLADLDQQVAQVQQLMDETQQIELEAQQQNAALTQLETQLQRLQVLARKLSLLKDALDAHSRLVSQCQQADENSVQIGKVHGELWASERELALVEKEAQQVQDTADAQEKLWRQLNLRRQLQEWHRLKSLSTGLTEAQQRVEAADRQREQLNSALLATRRTATIQLGIFIASIILAVLCGGGALVEALRVSYVFAAVAGMAALVLGAIGGVNLQTYGKTREEERMLDMQLQEANSRVAMMVAARETALRVGGVEGNRNKLASIEHEIRSLGGTVPHSLKEAQQLLREIVPSTPAETQSSRAGDIAEMDTGISVQGESIAEMQPRLAESRNAALAARSQVNVTMEAVAALRKEKARLQDLRQQEGWDDLNARLRASEVGLESLRQEIATAAGQEGLTVPSFTTPSSFGAADPLNASPIDRPDAPQVVDAQFIASLEESIKTTESRIAVINDNILNLPDPAEKARLQQEALDALLARKKSLIEKREQLQADDPLRQVERAREQQIALREALRALQDSLRQRVVPLGVSFGQTAISVAETTARKQLNALQVALAQKEGLKNRYTSQAALLQETREALSDHYRKLAKYSNSIGSWIVPPNPFADALRALRLRCDREIEEANEQSILAEQERLNVEQRDAELKIERCRQEIEDARERISTMLVAYNRPVPAAFKTCTHAEIIAVWPLVGEQSPQDRPRLESEIASTASELRKLEQLDLTLSEKLGIGKTTLDLEQARKRLSQQERIYATKERAGLLIAATFDRLMRKTLPRTEYYMQQLLPILTRGRYHDVQLFTEAEEGISSGGAIQIALWEPAAREYIPLSRLSSGIANQVSLALRLAFAIAVLPRELNAAPGFLILDEPVYLATSDRLRSLVDLLCGDLLDQHFEQILFVSHDIAFDSSRFSYRVFIDNGQVIESNIIRGTLHQEIEVPIIQNVSAIEQAVNAS